MNEQRTIVSFTHGGYTLIDTQGHLHPLVVGEHFELFLAGHFQPVQFCSGGYLGRYYQTPDGQRGRLALCMQARLSEGRAS